MIHLLDKPVGATPLDMIVKLRASDSTLFDVPITYAGRLDPMADGLLVLLSGEDRHNKAAFEDLPKTYEATILLGFTSDSYDALGLPKASHTTPSVDDVARAVQSLAGEHTLPFPPYSARRVAGKPLHEHVRSGTLHTITVPTTSMHVHTVSDIRIDTVTATALLQDIEERIALVRGQFRQKEIVQAWSALLQHTDTYLVLHATFSVSSGTYIRSLAHLLGAQLQCGALLLHLSRTRVGSYTLDQAHFLE